MVDNRPLPPAVCIMGPTASGKTALAVELARRLPVRIISVDSVMIYRAMDIGSAKPDSATLAAAPHHLIDILDPAEAYSAARFSGDAKREIARAHTAGQLPLLVGGSMLYFRALQHGLSPLPAASPTLRARLSADRQRLGSAALHARLAGVDPAAAARIHPNDPQRILRALEIVELSGRPASELFRRNGYQDRTRWLNIVLMPGDRRLLHQHIEQRFYHMLEQGLVGEVEALYQRSDLSLANPAARAVGYRQVWQYLDGLTDYATMVKGGIVATRQFAKRQLTWLRADNSAVVFNSQTGALLDNVLAVLQEHDVVICRNL